MFFIIFNRYKMLIFINNDGRRANDVPTTYQRHHFSAYFHSSIVKIYTQLASLTTNHVPTLPYIDICIRISSLKWMQTYYNIYWSVMLLQQPCSANNYSIKSRKVSKRWRRQAEWKNYRHHRTVLADSDDWGWMQVNFLERSLRFFWPASLCISERWRPLLLQTG